MIFAAFKEPYMAVKTSIYREVGQRTTATVPLKEKKRENYEKENKIKGGGESGGGGQCVIVRFLCR